MVASPVENLTRWLVTYGNYSADDLKGLPIPTLIELFDDEGTGEDARKYFGIK